MLLSIKRQEHSRNRSSNGQKMREAIFAVYVIKRAGGRSLHFLVKDSFEGLGQLVGYLAHAVDVGMAGGFVDVVELHVGDAVVLACLDDGGGDALFQSVVDEIDYLCVGMPVFKI